MGVHIEHVSQARSVAEDGLELRIMDDERRGPRREGSDGTRLAHTG
jgi:hypothetical protein